MLLKIGKTKAEDLRGKNKSRDGNRQFTEKETQMAFKCVKRQLRLLHNKRNAN